VANQHPVNFLAMPDINAVKKTSSESSPGKAQRCFSAATGFRNSPTTSTSHYIDKKQGMVKMQSENPFLKAKKGLPAASICSGGYNISTTHESDKN